MDFDFSFSSDHFATDLSEIRVVKTKRYDIFWQIGFGGSICNMPMLHDGVIYFGCCDKNLYAIDQKTGKELWRFRTGGLIFDSSTMA